MSHTVCLQIDRYAHTLIDIRHRIFSMTLSSWVNHNKIYYQRPPHVAGTACAPQAYSLDGRKEAVLKVRCRCKWPYTGSNFLPSPAADVGARHTSWRSNLTHPGTAPRDQYAQPGPRAGVLSGIGVRDSL